MTSLSVSKVEFPADDADGAVLGLDNEDVVVVWTDGEQRQAALRHAESDRRRAAVRLLVFDAPVAA